MTCKVHAISTLSFYSMKCYTRCLDGSMTCVKNLQTHYESLHMDKSQPNLTHVASVAKSQPSITYINKSEPSTT